MQTIFEILEEGIQATDQILQFSYILLYSTLFSEEERLKCNYEALCTSIKLRVSSALI